MTAAWCASVVPTIAWEEGGCAVDRGLDYDAAIVALRAAVPRFVAELEFLEDTRQRKAQRLRNLRAAGIH
jgi:hypothetical protein